MDVVDPRCYAAIGLPPDARGTITAVPCGGELVRAGETDRRARPFWAITFRVCTGTAPGAHVELRLWPESNPAWFTTQLSRLTGLEPEQLEQLGLESRHALLSRSLSALSYEASYETAADGRAEIRFIDASVPLVAPSGLPELPLARIVPAEPAAQPTVLTRPAFALITTAAQLAELCAQLAECRVVGVDIETDCGPLGSPAEWSPRDGAVRLIQIAGEVAGTIVCGVIDCYAVRPQPLIRLLADGRQIVAHNARYEQSWLRFHFGQGLWTDVLDTSCAFRLFERLWALQEPAYERRDATLGTVTGRMLGAAKGDHGIDWWGADPLTADQLDYAAYDAIAMLALRRHVVRIAGAFGNLEQVLAASRTACREAMRLPHFDPRAWTVAAELVDRDGVRAAPVIRRLPLTAEQRAGLRERLRQRDASVDSDEAERPVGLAEAAREGREEARTGGSVDRAMVERD